MRSRFEDRDCEMKLLDSSTDKTVQMLERALKRERHARRQVEKLLELRTKELDQLNCDLTRQADQLSRGEETIHSILTTTNDAFLMTDAAGAVKDWSPRAEQLFGWMKCDILNRNLRATILPEIPGAVNPLQSLLGDSRQGRRVATNARRSDGAEVPVEFSISPMLRDGQFVFTAFAHDISERQSMQAQLAHAQKMESVGQLAAGIAHEINTPIQYVGDNIRFLEEAVRDLCRLIYAYERASQSQLDSASAAQVEDAATVAEQIDLSFLRDEAPQAVRQAIDGTERVAQIVQAMKDFSHPGTKEKTALNVNRAIESTVTVCRNEWKYVADMKLQLDPSLPLVPCLPGELNQVILNLVVNAAHAIGDKNGPHALNKGTITISTSAEESGVAIRITDSGCGIAPENLGKIFNPFFTTKSVGRGTGQGLSIAYTTIVEKHGGRIDVESQVGVGTTFTIRLPVTIAGGIENTTRRSSL